VSLPEEGDDGSFRRERTSRKAGIPQARRHVGAPDEAEQVFDQASMRREEIQCAGKERICVIEPVAVDLQTTFDVC